MKKTLLALGLTLAFSAANAECIARTSSLTKVVGKITAITDARVMYAPTFDGEAKCAVRARVEYKSEWHTIFGEYTGPDVGRQDMCDNAVELAVRQFLASKEAKLVHSDQIMICSDEQPIKVRPVVQKGQVVRLSEVRLTPGKYPFAYKGVECRWFTETSLGGRDLIEWKGIVCLLDRNVSDAWTVVEKF